MKYSKFNLLIPYNKEENILFNTLSGNSFLVDDKTMGKMKENDMSEIDEELKKEMIEKKLIVPDEIDENRYFDFYHNKAKYGNNNLSYTILLTWACNLRCVYCYEGAGEAKSNSMTIETANSIIKHIKNESLQRGTKSVNIILFGGEPLVNYKAGEHILEELSQFCKENNMTLVTSIITNGTLLDERIVESLVKYNCKYVQITIDGTREIHNTRRIGKNGEGTFDKIIESLELLKKYKDKLHTVIRVNVDKTNIKDMNELMDFFHSKGLDELSIDFGIVSCGTDACSSYEDNCYVEEELGDLLSNLWTKAGKVGFDVKRRPMRKWTYCGLNCDNNFTIEPSGEMYKCWEHTGEEEHRIGKLDADGNIKDITYKYFEWMTRNPLNVEECRDCVYLPACGGGCGSVSYGKSEKYEDSGCFKIKGIVEEQVKSYFSEIINKG